MTPEQKAAFIVAQAALVNAKIAGMQAENQRRIAIGYDNPYTEKDFEAAANHHVLGWNAVIEFFRE